MYTAVSDEVLTSIYLRFSDETIIFWDSIGSISNQIWHHNNVRVTTNEEEPNFQNVQKLLW